MRDGSLSVVGTAGQFTSEKTTAYPYAGGFYIVDGDMLYFLDREWNLTPVEPYIPTCYTDVSADGSVKTESEKPNLFCQYIEIVLAAEGSSTRKIRLRSPLIRPISGYGTLRALSLGIRISILKTERSCFSAYTRSNSAFG